MSEVNVKGVLLNIPRYDIITATADALLRVLVSVKGTVLPVVCCNEVACSASKILLEAGQGREAGFSGTLMGSVYTDAVGSKNYLLYLVADRVAFSWEELQQLPENRYTPLQYKKLPFDVADLEDILKYME